MRYNLNRLFAIGYSLLAICAICVSCSYGTQIQETDTKVKELENKIIALTKELKELSQKLNKEQQQTEALKFELSVLRNELMEIRSPSTLPEQTLTERIKVLLAELSDPKCDTDKVIFELRKVGKRGAMALLEALKKPDLEYRKRVEKVFSGLLSEDAVPALLQGLKEPLLRTSCARILGYLKDYSVCPELNNYLSSDDDDFVFTLAEALVKLKDKSGIQVLIGFLKKQDSNKRAIAFDTLHKITGVTLNYKYYAEGQELIEGAKRWEDWWLKNAPTFTFPSD